MLQPANFPPLPEGWTTEWETFPASDASLQLYLAVHHPAGDSYKPGPVLLVIHGLGEHGGRYLHFPHYLQGAVAAVACLDLRGHGRSEGLRGHVERFDLFAEDVAVAIRRLRAQLEKRFGKSEIHLFGHSMGGLVSLRTLLTQSDLRLQSASICSPLLGIRVEVPWIKKTAGVLLSRVWGSIQMSNELDPKLVSHDPEVVQAYVADRLVHNKVTPRYFTELTWAMDDTLSKESGIACPVQFHVALDDQIVDPDAGLTFFRNLKHRDKDIKTYPGFFHEVFNEIGKERAFEDLRAWIIRHSANSSI